MKKVFLMLLATTWLPMHAQTEKSPLETPFYESFPAEYNFDSENSRWTVLDNNNDGTTWVSYRETGFGKETGYAVCFYNSRNNTIPSDDYLITKVPIKLSAGTAHLDFYYRGGGGEGLSKFPEAMDVYFGKSPNVADMEKIVDLEDIKVKDWTFHFQDFEVTEAGNYYFAFHAKSTPNQNRISLDEVRINKGAYQPVSELKAIRAILPANGCSPTASDKIGLTLTNTGPGTANGFTASYSLNGGKVVEEHFPNTVKTGDTVTIHFGQTADFSMENTVYQVKVQAASSDQLYQFNDTCSETVRNYSSVVVPYSIDFASREGQELFWYPQDLAGWMLNYNGKFYKASKVNTPLTSGCFNLAEGRYRLQCTWEAGRWASPSPITTDLLIMIGRSGTDYAQWDTIAHEKGLYTDFSRQTWESTFDISEAGNYSIVFITTQEKDLDLHKIELTQVQTHDVRIVSIQPDEFPRLIPIDQVAGKQQVLTVQLANKGLAKENVTLVAKQNGKPIFTTEPITIPEKSSLSHELALPYTDVAVGLDINLEITANVEEEDTNPENNTLARSFRVADTEYAYDNITEYTKSLGDDRVSCGYGKVFYLNNIDTLTSIKLAFDSREKDIPFTLKIYEVKQDNTIRSIYVEQMERKKEAGFQEFSLTPTLLEQGKYFFEVIQKGSQFIGLCYEKAEEGSYHVKSGWIYNEAYFNPDSIIEMRGGLLGIRPVFEQNAHPVGINLEAVKYVAPTDTNRMLSSEPIEVIYRNRGFEKFKNTVFHCLVDGKPVDTDVVNIEPYAESFLVRFHADLTALGKHVLTVYPEIEGDEISQNDTITKEVVSIAEGDPYTLDFELCPDFTTERLNPTWKSIDRDGGVTLGYSVANYPIEWPGMNIPFGFVAFNPAKTVPVAPEFFKGYHGKRFGASFFVQNGKTNNDWLVSPKLALGEKPSVKFMVKSQADNYGLEDYNVLVSTTGTEEADFIKIGDTRQAPVKWENVEIDLSAYKNKEVHVAIQCVSKDKFIFLIDNIQVVKSNNSHIADAGMPQSTLFVDSESKVLHIHLAGNGTSEKISKVSVYNMAGDSVMESQVDAETFRTSVSALPAGVYVCRIQTNTARTEMSKFVIK